MRSGVILFRGTGAAARRYLEADRSGADEYYLEASGGAGAILLRSTAPGWWSPSAPAAGRVRGLGHLDGPDHRGGDGYTSPVR